MSWRRCWHVMLTCCRTWRTRASSASAKAAPASCRSVSVTALGSPTRHSSRWLRSVTSCGESPSVTDGVSPAEPNCRLSVTGESSSDCRRWLLIFRQLKWAVTMKCHQRYGELSPWCHRWDVTYASPVSCQELDWIVILVSPGSCHLIVTGDYWFVGIKNELSPKCRQWYSELSP